MTTRRYRNYQRALELLGALDPRLVSAEDRDSLADLGEGLLLSRAVTAQEVREETDRLAEELSTLMETGAIPAVLANDLWRTICAAGPIRPGTLAPDAKSVT